VMRKIFFLVLFATGCNNIPSIEHSSTIGYAQAISIYGGLNADDLQSCVRGWNSAQAQRDNIAKDVNRDAGVDGNVEIIIEIGNSGFDRYDYLFTNKGILNSSLGTSKIISAELQNTINSIASDKNFWDKWSARDVFDDDCYFVSVINRNISRTIAIYGLPENSKAALLVNQIMTKARQ
jgi:hypothetical protein